MARSSAAMSPRKPAGSSSLASSSPSAGRKRDVGAAALPGRSGSHKHQATQESAGDPFNNSPFCVPPGVDFLDLTGSDVDENATFVASQIRAEHVKREKQREAVPLGGQVPAPSPLRPVTGSSRPYGGTPQKNVKSEGQRSAGAIPSSTPGSSRSSNSLTPPAFLKAQQLSPSRQPAAPQPSPSRRPAVPQPPMQPMPQAAVPGASQAPAMAPPMPLPAHMTGLELSGTSIVGNLADLIYRTNHFDYATGVDELGRPLPDRLAHFLDGYNDREPVSEKELDDLLKNIRPDIDDNLDAESTPQGLKLPLYRHQSVALSWMKKMEEGSNKGGILADDMGLGKTISTLALMMSRKATGRPRTNLIITPKSLLPQWEEELIKKISPSHRFSIFVYHEKKAYTEELLQYDVVLTTFGTVAAQHKRFETYHEENKGRYLDYSDRSTRTSFPLFLPGKAKFYRVILDEAQMIKNRETKSAKACQQIRADFRWCLTGTPMMNGVVELYSPLWFLRIRPYNNWDHFRGAFKPLMEKVNKNDLSATTKVEALDRLRAVLKAVMMRRKKDSKIDGRPILELPEKTVEEVYVELSKEEREFYDQLEHKSQVQFNKYLRDDSIGKNYSYILVLLLRMRQACCHPHLNLDVFDSTASLVSEEQMLKIVQALDLAIVSRIKVMTTFECPICLDYVYSPSFLPCGHMSCSQCFTRLVDGAWAANLRDGVESDMAKCPVCRTLFDAKKCFTYGAFQKVHMPDKVRPKVNYDDEFYGSMSDSTDESDESDEDDPGSEVDDNGDLKGFVVDDDFADDSDDDESDSDRGIQRESKVAKVKAEVNGEADVEVKAKGNTEVKAEDNSEVEAGGSVEVKAEDKRDVNGEAQKEGKRKKKGKRKSNGKARERRVNIKPSMLRSLREDSVKNQANYLKYMTYLKQTWLPSAKVTMCIKLLKQASAAREKVIVFSQWTLLLDLIQIGLEEDQLPGEIRRYDGKLTTEQRFETVRDFRDDKNFTVMLVSLKCGNSGLNLTAASRVIIMDPFWNPYVERQAIDRAHRIGQLKEVKVYRILAPDTVEDRIMELQRRKEEMIEAALDEAEGMKISRLDAKQLKFLFFKR